MITRPIYLEHIKHPAVSGNLAGLELVKGCSELLVRQVNHAVTCCSGFSSPILELIVMRHTLCGIIVSLRYLAK